VAFFDLTSVFYKQLAFFFQPSDERVYKCIISERHCIGGLDILQKHPNLNQTFNFKIVKYSNEQQLDTIILYSWNKNSLTDPPMCLKMENKKNDKTPLSLYSVGAPLPHIF
jgi:hypothetical protein